MHVHTCRPTVFKKSYFGNRKALNGEIVNMDIWRFKLLTESYLFVKLSYRAIKSINDIIRLIVTPHGDGIKVHSINFTMEMA